MWHLYCKYGMGKCTKYIRISASVSPRRRVCEMVNEKVGHVIVNMAIAQVYHQEEYPTV